jgi:hypothetical protein
MAAKQLIAAVTGAAYVNITASTYATYVEIQEDGSGVAAGLKVKFPSDNFTAVYEYPPAAQPIKIGIPPASGFGAGKAPLVGKPDITSKVPNQAGGYTNVDQPATVYCQVESMGATTVVRVDERP